MGKNPKQKKDDPERNFKGKSKHMINMSPTMGQQKKVPGKARPEASFKMVETKTHLHMDVYIYIYTHVNMYIYVYIYNTYTMYHFVYSARQ